MIPTPTELEPCPDRCGALVLWTLTEHGRRMAVDAEPHEKGNQAVFKNGPGGWRSRSLDGAESRALDPWEHRYKPHVATCTRRTAQQAIPGLPAAGRPRTRRRAPARRYPRWTPR
ncbi:hypothetical protein ACFYUV_38220 [Nonomuraea sp. NPDC003560]|uniref:hypothetical protein n=1 Tax=Nonomuraea sp. NPDC003560 TaxID=3364341 RepID=UPI0036AFEF9A